MKIRVQLLADDEWTAVADDPAELTQPERLDAIEALERAKNQLDALQLKQIQAMAADTSTTWVTERQRRDAVLDEIACAMRWSVAATVDRLIVAEALVIRFPDTMGRLEQGDFGFGHAKALLELTRHLEPSIAGQVEARVLPRAGERTQADFRRAVKRAIAAIDPAGELERHDREDARRHVTLQPAEHAMATVNAYLSADDAQTVLTAVQAVADRMKATAPPGEKRTADQWRADGLVALSAAALTGGRPGTPVPGWDGFLPRWQGHRPSIQVTVALSTLLGLDEQPAELAGHGSVPAQVARRMAADRSGTWRRLVTDELGHLLDHGRTVYKPPADLRDFVVARDATSRFPGEFRDARRCQLDHRKRWEHGGSTNAGNLQVLSARGHRAKDDRGWSVEATASGVLLWASRLGRTYEVPPHRHPVDRTTEADIA